MPEITVLSSLVADKIAAGEVAERPMSVVKELVENSIDAGADKITVEIKNGGISYISVTDNGCGISADEVEIAFMRHATSKLREVEDLEKISTMGFRGEALASICAVADIEVVTKTDDEDEGTFIKLSHSQVVQRDVIACNRGTIMMVKNLFANIPARMKFLKKDSTESGYVSDILSRIAMAHPDIAFKLISDEKEVFATSGDGNLKNVILKIYGLEYAKSVIELNFSENGFNLSGVIGKPEISRGNRTRQTIFVNGRYIKNHIISKVIEDGYRNAMMKGKFPFFVINIGISPELVDVNVHPAKTEVKFANEQRLYETVSHAVKNALYSGESYSATDYDSMPDTNSTRTAIQGTESANNYSESASENREYKENKENTTTQYKFNMSKLSVSQPSRNSVSHLSKAEQKSAFEFLDTAAEFKAEINKRFENTNTAENSNVFVNEKKVSETEYLSDSIVIEDVGKEPEEKIIGQLFNTYIITEDSENMYLIDQHAAHERFRFENLLRKYKERIAIGQMLLVPVVMSLTPPELTVIEENSERFFRMGFEIEDFGNNSIIIRQTPIELGEEGIKNLVTELIGVFEQNRNRDISDIELHALETISCKRAIKANKPLSAREMQDVINKLNQLSEMGITTCPHGRPIKVTVSKTEIEKMFKRIV